MTTQYERFFFWLGQLMSGNATNPSSVNPQQQYRKIENPAIRTGKIGK